MGKLATAFPASFSDDKAVSDRALLWRELLDANPWITKGVFTTGVYALVWKHSGNFIPEPATALGYFDGARVKVARETAKALPKPTGGDPRHWFRDATTDEIWAVFAEHFVFGKAKQRQRREPSEEELADVRREMDGKRWWQKRVLPPEVRELPRGGG